MAARHLHGIKYLPCFILFLSFFPNAHSQETALYNTDSLLASLSENEKISQVLATASVIYANAGIDTNNISLTAFKLAFLEKSLIDSRAIRVRKRHRYKNRKILTVVDYTRKGNAMRFLTIDLVSLRILHDTLVSQGAGKGAKKNDKYRIPVFFSNTINSEAGSLGLLLTSKQKQTTNPCHLCKYAASVPHKDVIVLEGLERGINDHVKKRDIVIHTTGSKDLNNAASDLPINDPNYRMDEAACKCYHTDDDGKLISITAYASACGLAENNGYIGQSDGCLVLPEDHHIEIMKAIRHRSLIFIYSNVVTEDYNYFRDSPIIKKIVAYAGRREK